MFNSLSCFNLFCLEYLKGPAWLENLLSTTFFLGCEIHNKHRNECNKYCLDCTDDAFCSHCIPTNHKGHHVIQIRRSSYQECVRVGDIEKALEIDGVQTFVINGAKVIFLNKRGRCISQTKNTGGGNLRNNFCKNTAECMTCGRTLLEPFCFCSIECKFEWIRNDDSGRFVLGVKKDEEEAKTIPKEMATLSSEEEKDKELKEETNKEESETVIAPPPIQPPRPVSYNSRKRKGIPRRAPFF
ncbi:putative transcription repressor PLATZ family [Lupinus albus]|uniref:Putative transcription repressor PLATZ family n=1 Tax=Lupinus albus TaxID=3870 RepID=A0A6A4PGI1_LUPAL|nr:putative transcription repressor PLATZ family [Lupinus albus]